MRFVRFHTHVISSFILLQCNTTLLPSVNAVAGGVFCGAKCTHPTFMPIIKHH